jgi:hypothetical protein
MLCCALQLSRFIESVSFALMFVHTLSFIQYPPIFKPSGGVRWPCLGRDVPQVCRGVLPAAGRAVVVCRVPPLSPGDVQRGARTAGPKLPHMWCGAV